MCPSCFIYASLQQPQRRLQDPTQGCVGGTDRADFPSIRLGNGRWVVKEATPYFETPPKDKGLTRSFSREETGGCTCEQIISFCGYGEGHKKFGCSNSVMEWWTAKYSRGDGLGALYECHEEEEVVRE